MPPPVVEALNKAAVPLENVAIVVKQLDAPNDAHKPPLVSHRSEQPQNPASVMKLLTTYAGLALLGPGYAWKTEVYLSGDLRGDTLNGDLILRGSGDPKLTIDRFETLLKQLRARGLRQIKGDLILDKTSFNTPAHDPARFDNEPLRAYNVGPDPLLLNFKTVRFQLAPSLNNRMVAITPDARPIQLQINNRLNLSEGPCGDWRERLGLDIQTRSLTQLTVTFKGNYPRSCGEKTWNVALLDHARFIGGVFAEQWQALGGRWAGDVKVTNVPANARLIASLESPALAEIVRDINKYSNNVMAQQLFLSLSASPSSSDINNAGAGSFERSNNVILAWLKQKNIPREGLVLENGSGLSRLERISAQTLVALLESAWQSPVMPEFLASLSLYGVDGTLRKRTPSQTDSPIGRAHLKSGTLNDTRAIAGYLQDAEERRWVVVMLINHPNAPQAQSAQDALLQWVYQMPVEEPLINPSMSRP
ncbi:MAG: D-alanyl-D-alanine carboxypeptidase/D-alanyl-D-alanine-endopeptidase [Betaproteobacteria bacterium]|nr:D-alanyl-D-alanine carboxypeptidase/D-alanyl-D-alanine-endopeptidase [Betaproteobacteria bacterium]